MLKNLWNAVEGYKTYLLLAAVVYFIVTGAVPEGSGLEEAVDAIDADTLVKVLTAGIVGTLKHAFDRFAARRAAASDGE